jgi:hypothetical protein
VTSSLLIGMPIITLGRNASLAIRRPRESAEMQTRESHPLFTSSTSISQRPIVGPLSTTGFYSTITRHSLLWQVVVPARAYLIRPPRSFAHHPAVLSRLHNTGRRKLDSRLKTTQTTPRTAFQKGEGTVIFNSGIFWICRCSRIVCSRGPVFCASG